MESLLRVVAVAFIASFIPAIVLLVRCYGRYCGQRLIVCPIDKRVARVRLDALHAAWTAVVGETEFRIASCSEWPARKDCSAECLERAEGAFWEGASQPDGGRSRLSAAVPPGRSAGPGSLGVGGWPGKPRGK